MRPFFIGLYVLTGVLHLPFVVAVHTLLHRAGVGWSWLLASATGLTLWWLFHGRMTLLRWDRKISRPRALAEEAYFVHWCALAAWWPSLLVVAALSPFVTLPAVVAGWSGWKKILFLSYLPALLLALWAVVVRRRLVRVRTIVVPLPELPESFVGYRIAHLSDIHLGSLCPRVRVERWVERVNALQVDMVALTGDYVTTGVRFHRDIANALGGLRARDGVYAVMGNHDYFGDGQPLMDLLQDQGVQLLRNQRATVKRKSAALALAGVDDLYTRRLDIDAALRGHRAGEPLLVLAHDPCSFVELAERGADLVLSGHTHWGQIALPFAPERFNYAGTLHRHHASLNRHNGAWLYVSPGLGTTGPPARLGTWPEISIIELAREGRASIRGGA